MKFSIMTLFPEYMDFLLGQSIIGRARKAGILEIRCHNFRDYAHDRHSTVDDTPYGGGMGHASCRSRFTSAIRPLWNRAK